MSKYYRNRPLTVSCREGGEPEEIGDAGQGWRVEELLERWQDTGRWWEGESEKAFFRLLLEGGGVMEVFRDLHSGAWYLYKSYD